MEASQWARALRYCGEDFDKIYYQLWHQFMTDGSLQELIDFCDDYYHFAAPSFTHDNTKWNRGNAQSYATVTSLAKDWLLKRANYIYDYMSNTMGYKDLGYLDDIDDGILMGDVNDDGQVTTADVVCVLNYMLNLPNEEFEFAKGIESVDDLVEGMELPGIVTNITNFGAFVDIGVHQDGLVHISQLADKFVKDPNAVVKLHQHVRVRVIEVDRRRNRISLSMRGLS